MIVSTWATTSLEEVATASGCGLRWFQLYIYRDRQLTHQLVKRAERNGYKALVVTVDSPEKGKQYANVREKFKLPPHLRAANFSQLVVAPNQQDDVFVAINRIKGSGMTWDCVDWLCSITSLPIILKGILTAEDARIALKHNVQGILVSNHGARQLDGVPATVSCV